MITEAGDIRVRKNGQVFIKPGYIQMATLTTHELDLLLDSIVGIPRHPDFDIAHYRTNLDNEMYRGSYRVVDLTTLSSTEPYTEADFAEFCEWLTLIRSGENLRLHPTHSLLPILRTLVIADALPEAQYLILST